MLATTVASDRRLRPIFPLQALHLLKGWLIAHQNGTQTLGVAGDQQIQGGDCMESKVRLLGNIAVIAL